MFTEDLTTFFNTAELADAALLDGVPVVGVIEAGFQAASLDGFGHIAGTSPSFTLPSNDVPPNPEGKPLVVTAGPSAGTYRIANQRHDGTGVCTLELID